MSLGLNNSAPESGTFTSDAGALWSSIGGPLFIIIQALLFLAVTAFTKSVYAFSVTCFAVFSRFFSLIFGGIDLQDEARIASMLDVNKYLVAASVLVILGLILWYACRIMKFKMKAIGFFTVLGVSSILFVIGTDKLFFAH